MRLPGWLDLALEGGVTELQRAFAETIALRRSLRGRWREHADTLAEKSRSLWLRQMAIDDALERARKRARLDRGARAVLPLVERLEHERASLQRDLERWLGARRLSSSAAFRQTIELAEEHAWFESAWRRFRLERGVLGVLLALFAGGIPFICWLHASRWGVIPTFVAFPEIRHLPQYWFGLSLLLGASGLSWWRLGSWQWLGLRRGSLTLPALMGSAITVFTGMVYMDGAVGLGLGALAAALTMGLSCACYSLWLPKPRQLRSPAEPVDPAVATEKTAAGRAAC